MPTTTSQVTADGRTVVQIHDDRGEPFRFVSNGVDVQSDSFVDLFFIPLNPDPSTTPPRPALVRGQILISTSLAFDDTVYDFVFDEIIVTGFVGSTGTVIAQGTLSTADPLMRVNFGDEDTFDKIVVSARQNINGAPSGASNGIFSNSITAVANMWT